MGNCHYGDDRNAERTARASLCRMKDYTANEGRAVKNNKCGIALRV
jgi:hypothetical protein